MSFEMFQRPKITKHRAVLLVDKDVACLDVAMTNSFLVQKLQPPQDIHGHLSPLSVPGKFFAMILNAVIPTRTRSIDQSEQIEECFH